MDKGILKQIRNSKDVNDYLKGVGGRCDKSREGKSRTEKGRKERGKKESKWMRSSEK